MSAQLGTTSNGNHNHSSNNNNINQNNNNNTSKENEDNFTSLERLITITSLPMTLKVASELDIFSIIARAGSNRQLSVAEIAAELPTKNPEAASMLDRMLRLLASYSILTCSVAANNNASDSSFGPSFERLYGLAPLAKYLVPDQDGLSLAPWIPLTLHETYFCSWDKLKDAVIEGGDAFTLSYGENVYDYAGSNAGREFNDILNKAMFNYSSILIKEVLRSYNGFKDPRIKVLVDVGGGVGHNIRAIISEYPSTVGINFDLPHVIHNAVPSSGVRHASGDMFVAVPQGDAIFMKWILHNWSDEFCVKILKNCYKSLPEDGKVIIVERMPSTMPETTVAAKAISQMDLTMMTCLPFGKERSREEYTALANAAGFLDIKFVGPILNFWIIELYKNSSMQKP